MIKLGQYCAGFYMGTTLSFIRHGGHYLGYAIFTLVFFHWLRLRNLSPYKIILFTFFLGLSISISQEVAYSFVLQKNLSVFDLGDIAKGGWSIVIVLFFIFSVIYQGKSLWPDKEKEKNILQFIQTPGYLLLTEITFMIFSLIYTDIVSASRYRPFLIALITFSFLTVFFLIYFAQNKIFKKILLGFLSLCLIIQAFAFWKYHKQNINYYRFGFTVNKGIPIPLFDQFVYPNGFFRLVDKKHVFNQTGQNRIFGFDADLYIGKGFLGFGGKGFEFTEILEQNNDYIHGFVFNEHFQKKFEVIILKSTEACKLYNKLKKEGKKKLLLVFHSTC